MTGRRILFILALLPLCTFLRAQVVILNDNLFNGRLSEIQATVVDSLSQEPIPFASFYVIPAKDTTITNFTLTDAKGAAKLDEVPFGNYTLHVEMMGYKPFVRERYFRQERIDLGTIRLQADELFLQAATVTDIGNPIIIKKDTVEFNAASFRVGANAMLKDLLRRMPGMEITDDGKVKFNGEEIDKLTVGGRTFFFGDQSMALNNLPASVVDKIRVIDRESEQSRDTGIKDSSREKVLDVGLKKEYEKGWFGNIGLKGGAPVPDKQDAVLRDTRSPLYAGNVLASGYSEKDQLTLIANAQNFDDSGMVFVVVDDSGDYSYLNQGLSTAYQLGANVNTSRIKDVESTVGANYSFSDTDSGTKNLRTTRLDGGDLVSDDSRSGKMFSHRITSQMEFKKETGKVRFRVEASYQHSRRNADELNTTEASQAGAFVNSSTTRIHSQETEGYASLNSSVTFRDLWGKEKRNLRFNLYGTYDKEAGTDAQTTVLRLKDATDNRQLDYTNDGKDAQFGATVNYVEPIGEKWSLSTFAGAEFRDSRRIRDAFEGAGRNDYLSSSTHNRSVSQDYGMRLQYSFAESSWIQAALTAQGLRNEVNARAYGNDSVSGYNRWTWFLMPEISLEHSWGLNRFSFDVSTYPTEVSSSRLLPALNTSDPTHLSLGNVYLKPSTNSYFRIYWSHDDRERFQTLMFDLTGTMLGRPTVDAQWYDADGVLYRIPVNASKPSARFWASGSFTTPLNKKKTWSLSLNAGLDYASATSFLARRTVKSPDKDAFDYTAFMAEFWGDATGDRFYGGLSGFDEYRTSSFMPNANIRLRLNQEMYSLEFGARVRGQIDRYTPKLDIDRNTLQTSLTARGTFTTRHEFEFESDLSYVFYKGYSPGYGLPEWQWNASVSKNLGAFNLSLTAHDILNQTRNLNHTVSANYVEDSYRLVLGRYILFGVKWNFGKMNAAHSRRAQDAAWDMLW